MHILNFSHPLTERNLGEIAAMTGVTPAAMTVQNIPCQVDRSVPILDAAKRLLDAVAWYAIEESQDWYLIVPPGMAPIALALVGILAHNPPLSGYAGWLNIRPVADSTPTRYEVAEVVL